MALQEVKVPDIGDFKEVEVIEVLVKVGDTIAKDQSLITVESDKASMEIPSAAAGVVKEIKVKVGDKVGEGTLVLMVEAGASTADAPAPAPAAAAPAPAPAAAAVAVAVAAAAGSAGPVLVSVPDIGDFKDVEVIEVMVKVGDNVRTEQSLITVESDKASMEIPSLAAGAVTEVLVKVGDKVNKGTPLVKLTGSVGAAAAASAAAPAPAAAAPAVAAAPVAQAPAAAAASAMAAAPAPAADGKLAHASPSVRAFARELGVDINRVPGTGPKGRITPDDVRSYVKGAVAALVTGAPAAAGAPAGSGGGNVSVIDWPKVDFSKFGEVETKPLSRIKKLSGANLHRNWVMIPHVTNHEDADITDLEAFRVKLNEENAKSGAKLTMLAFLIKACVAALKKFPEFNASLEGESLVLKKYFHIGFAADTPNGLVVPVIRDADKKGVFEIAKETADLAALAREGKLSPAQMQGGCFSISSLGGIGGTYFTPIINAPEVAILGVCRSSMKPVWNGSEFAPRLILPMSLSWDHRVIDGAAAARFNTYLATVLADFRRVML
ncbi:dihydrolipoamide acetyltransferase [beta proteobacterium AAP99]|nr:dihydrolipoamide acetyltransferase [beta proteobacterium AAP99]